MIQQYIYSSEYTLNDTITLLPSEDTSLIKEISRIVYNVCTSASENAAQ
jgi:hypothetical protein